MTFDIERAEENMQKHIDNGHLNSVLAGFLLRIEKLENFLSVVVEFPDAYQYEEEAE